MSSFFAVYGEHAHQAFKEAQTSLALSKPSSNAALTNPIAEYHSDFLYVRGPQSCLKGFANFGHLKGKFASFECNNEHELALALNELPNDFTFSFKCSYHDNPNALVLAVSPFNANTLFYAQHPKLANTLYVSSNINYLLNLVSPIACATSLALWLAGRPDPNRSMYKNIHQVGQGHFVSHSFKNDKKLYTNVVKFYDIKPSNKDTSMCGSEASQALRELLSQSVAQALSPAEAASNQQITEQSVFTQLSGGMDSTSVSALAYSQLSNSNTPLHSVSHTYVNTKSCDETNNIQAMIARYPFAQSHFIELDKYTQLSFAELYPTHPQSPGMVLSPKYFEEAKLLKAHSASIMLTGNGGDEMCWGHSFAYYDRAKQGDLGVFLEVARSAKTLGLSPWRVVRSAILGPMLHYDIMPMLKAGEQRRQQVLFTRSLHIPPWLTSKSEGAVREEQVKKFAQNPFVDEKGNTPYGLAKYARYEGLFYTSTFNSMRSYQAVFEQFNLSLRHPFFNKDVANFSFAVNQHEHISGEYPKLLLRKAMSDALPSEVCWNTHKTVFDQHFAKLVQQNAHSLRKLLSHPGLESMGLVSNTKLLQTFDALVNSPEPSLNVDLLYAILVQSWYQTHILKEATGEVS